MNKKTVRTRTIINRILALCGSVLIITCAFAPIVLIPLAGKPNLFDLYRIQEDVNFLLAAIFCICLGTASIYIALRQSLKWLWLTGCIGLSAWITVYIKYLSGMEDAHSNIKLLELDDSLHGIAESMLGGVQLQWGAYTLLAGSIVLLLAAWSKD
jgi:hypothetical protein